MKFLRLIDKIFSAIESFMLVVLLSLLVGLAFLQVLLFNLFDYSIMWLDLLLRHMVVWTLFFGAAQATRHNRHLNIDALTKTMKDSHKKLISLFINAFCLFIVIIFIKGGWDFVLDSMDFGSEAFLGIKLWIFQLIIPVGMVLIGYRFLLHFIEALVEMIKGEKV